MEVVKALGRVKQVRGLWGLWMVNGCAQEAFLFAMPFRIMCASPGRYVTNRQRQTHSDLVRYPDVGDVIGVVLPTAYGQRISLYFGHHLESLVLTTPTEPPRGTCRIEHYDFAGDDLDVHCRYLALVADQDAAFEMALLGADFDPEKEV